MQIHWSGATRFHDWLGSDRATPRRMLEKVQDAGLIGVADWYSVGDADRKTPKPGVALLEFLLGRTPRRGLPLLFGAGGEFPFAWEMAMLLSPYDVSDRQVCGYNMLNLWFPLEPFAGTTGSDTLIETFREIHHNGNTEFAFLHPHPRWSELSDVIDGEYSEPLTIGPMFTGVFWTMFLGWGHLSYFDTALIRKLKAYQVEWDDEKSLFLRVSEDVGKATSEVVEAQMFQLTEEFRRARR